jgi:hypothetical protein
MGTETPFVEEKLIFGILISREAMRRNLLNRLTQKFGRIDFESEILDFEFTHYYDREMGVPIKRFFVSIEQPMPPDTLADIKLQSNRMEHEFSENGKRRVNLDPGFLTLSRLVLATTKEGSHRIPLSSGIYGEVTLLFEKGDFRPLPWTYPDFRSDIYREILKKIREIYKRQRRSLVRL